MSSSYRIELDNWLKNLDVKADRVLDIGGSQLPVKGRTKSWDVKEYLIADLPNPHKDSPKPDIEMDIQTYNAFAPYTDVGEIIHHNPLWEFADIIFCLEVFDYIYDPMSAFKSLAILMKKGCIAWVTFPSVYPLHQPVKDDALRYMPGGIKKLAEASGLEIAQMIPRRTETDAIYNAFRVERMRCAKHEDHNISGWIAEMRKP